jgi:hypothetical protein
MSAPGAHLVLVLSTQHLDKCLAQCRYSAIFLEYMSELINVMVDETSVNPRLEMPRALMEAKAQTDCCRI